MVEIKRVSYGYNSLLAKPFFLDVFSSDDGVTKMDRLQTFTTKEEFANEIKEVVNILNSVEDRTDDQYFLDEVHDA